MRKPDPKRSGRKLTFGPELWSSIGELEFSFWDLWLLAVLEFDHAGDWEALDTTLLGATPSYSSTETTEAKLAHLADLRRRMDKSRLIPSDVLPLPLDPKILRRAHEVVLRPSIERATPAMAATPRRLFRERALRGHWRGFPKDPSASYDKFRHEIDSRSNYGETATMRLAGRLGRLLLSELKGCRGEPAEVLACYRAFLTALIEAHERSSDSVGCLADLERKHVPGYLSVDWRLTGILPAIYYRDLLEFATWDIFVVIDDESRRAIAQSVQDDEIDLVESILNSVVAELETHHFFDFQIGQALELLAEIYVAKGFSHRFAHVAGRLGPDGWQTVELLAEAALAAGRRDLAMSVFAAADRPGLLRDNLTRSCVKLLGEPPAAKPLYLVAENPSAQDQR